MKRIWMTLLLLTTTPMTLAGSPRDALNRLNDLVNQFRTNKTIINPTTNNNPDLNPEADQRTETTSGTNQTDSNNQESNENENLVTAVKINCMKKNAKGKWEKANNIPEKVIYLRHFKYMESASNPYFNHCRKHDQFPGEYLIKRTVARVEPEVFSTTIEVDQYETSTRTDKIDIDSLQKDIPQTRTPGNINLDFR